jgi:hypothetical protein
MAKKKEKTKLPKADDVASAKPVLEKLNASKERLGKVKEAVTQEGKANKQDPRYRQALKRVKRAQRKLNKELKRVAPSMQAKESAEAEKKE